MSEGGKDGGKKGRSQHVSVCAFMVAVAAIVLGCWRKYPPDKHAGMYFDYLYLLGLHTVARVDGSMMRQGAGLDLPSPGQSLQGKVAVITGSTKGIGFHAARRFHSHGAHVVMTGRKREDAISSAARVKSYTQGSGRPVGFGLDLADFGSVRYFAGEVLKTYGKVNYLILNGAMTTWGGWFKEDKRYWISSTGHSRPYAANYLGHYLLTLLLVPYMEPGGSIVVASSITAWWADPKWLRIDFGVPVPDISAVKPHLQRHYLADGMYAASKLAGMCFANTLREKVAIQNITVVTMTPGQVDTDLAAFNPAYEHVKFASVGPEDGARVLFESAFATGDHAKADFLYPYWFPSMVYRFDAPQRLAPRIAGPPNSLDYLYEDPAPWIWRPERFQARRFRLHASVGPECDSTVQRQLWLWSRDAVVLPQRLDSGDVFARSKDVWEYKAPPSDEYIYGRPFFEKPPTPREKLVAGKGRG